ncbi:hypothetical protein EHS25_003743 [Saitozyma podzolica]|uniref:Wax synthase domain-containing protein n=1 Tax=Saitozyma podzolica TaxID=1890683 RepID=A0A427Y3B0_9TREE|nr:hypothetical protein EHS25_003743 [Saitozyma podzolica]
MTPHLAVPLVPPPPTLILIAALLLPYGIAYLAHLPRTRLVRIGVYPLSLVCGLWVALAVEHPKLKLDDETAPSVLGVGSVGSSEARGLAAIKAMRIIMWHIGAATRYAFTTLPPVPHPLPRQPPFPRLRSTTAFRALDLLLNEYRHINLASSSPLQPSLRTYRQSLLYHLRCAVFHLLLIDLFSYPFFRVAPNTIGSPFHVGGEYYPIRADIAGALGVPELVVQIGATACLGLVTYHGIGSMWHISAILGIGSGVWVDEEWVELMDRPWMATSLSELWGKRYHQLMRVRGAMDMIQSLKLVGYHETGASTPR